jgi:hypothetical protein
MRFMLLVKSSENCGPPPKELMEAIWKNGESAANAGQMIESGGLKPSALSARVQLRGGRVSTLDGPFAEAKEVVGGFAIFEFGSMKEAIASATKFMELHRKYWPGWQGETEIRPMFDRGEFLAGTHNK